MDDVTWLGPPIDARPYFEAEHAALVDLLRGLDTEGWRAPAVPGWTVRDVAAHVLGDHYFRIAGMRDGYHGSPGPALGETLAQFVHRSNAEWVRATARISPAALVQTLELTGREVAGLWQKVDLASAGLGVPWAGVDPAPVWLDCARELTEYWTHRQQIRHATGQDTDPEPETLALVLDTFLRALPHTLRTTPALAGTRVVVEVDGPAGGSWTVTSTETGWSLAASPGTTPAAGVRFDPETTWRLCTRGIHPHDAMQRATLDGDRRLAEAVCHIVSIIH